MKKEKLVPIGKLRKILFDDWALRVKIRDGFKCLCCGGDDNLTSHHWYICDHFAHMARYCVDNGATLCYTDHIRKVHQRADFASVAPLYRLVSDSVERSGSFLSTGNIEMLSRLEVTVPQLRALYAEMRLRRVELRDVASVNARGGKVTVATAVGCNQQAVAGNVVILEGKEFDVVRAGKVDRLCRYTLTPFSGE